MKNILLPLFLIGLILIQACEGPVGPEGPQGPAGITVEADIFETVGTFTEQDGFAVGNTYEAFGGVFLPTDKLLIYHLWEEGVDDVWRLLPQTIFLEQGIFQYNFDFTNFDFQIFLQGNFDLNLLGPEWTDEQVFRLVIIPTVATNFRIDYSNYEEVVKHFNLDESNIPRIPLK